MSYSFKNIYDLIPQLSNLIDKVNLESDEFLQKVVVKNRETVNNFIKLLTAKKHEITKSINSKINDLNRVNLNSLKISKKIILKRDIRTLLIKENQHLQAYNDDSNISMKEILKISEHTYELEKEIYNELKKL